MSNSKKITLYKYMSTDYLLDILRNEHLFMNDGNYFNDPYELLLIDNDGNQNRIPGMHILCLTNSYMKKLMWSHYANSHKGVCLTVEVDKSIVYSVCYTSHRIHEADNIDEIIANSLIGKKRGLGQKNYNNLSYYQKVAFLKDKKWYDEKEYRIALEDTDLLTNVNGNWFLPVKIKNVYLGVDFDLNNNQEVINVCLEKGIHLTLMQISNTNYSLKTVKWEGDRFVE